MEYTTNESEAATDTNKNYYNRRTGEVLPAQASDPVGRVKQERGGWKGMIFGGGGNRTFKSGADGVFWVLRD